MQAKMAEDDDGSVNGNWQKRKVLRTRVAKKLLEKPTTRVLRILVAALTTT